ncbi:hypothetical protein PACTADRAFT_50481 [Pachysolen tannophilus NRRL Y-2460]|uniref:6-phosphofructo-2-kinase domain-containing protein n=1 Tax=Pachysolen tannophilus NRRL Y-2460 TaxID=669874 RepID=A0A1E4TS82_PACTA|nr:hypothetical protein PACTADRAFT_50481 [Pachysolen tannophilus NRRL Y-2460]
MPENIVTESSGRSEPLGDDTSIQPPQQPGNYMARVKSRWSNPFSESHNDADDKKISGGSGENIERDLKKRRISNSDFDAIHQEVSSDFISPAQLYSTESGRLFHAGQLCIALCGLPARGKTHLSVSLCRYLRWLGVKAKIFHLGDYRRSYCEKKNISQTFWNPLENANEREEIVNECISDIASYFENDKGQVVIYDAINALSKDRLDFHSLLTEKDVKVLFIESIVTDERLLHKNVSDASKSPDYENWDPEKATENYISRIKIISPIYQEMNEPELTYIKFINFGENIVINNDKFGFLVKKIVFFLMNSRIKSGSVFFARCSNNKLKFKSDPPLDEKGSEYFKKLNKTLLDYISKSKGDNFYQNIPIKSASKNEKQPPIGFDGQHENDFVVWTSTRLRTIQASQSFTKLGIKTRERTQLTQKNPGDVEGLTDEEIKEKYPEDYEKHQQDPYHHRYGRAESYHDLAVKIEPLILEMERMSGDILIIADETVIRVFYGYLMACSCNEIPFLEFPQNEIVQIQYNAYSNIAKRITIEGVDP